jgi:hypothetical protein
MKWKTGADRIMESGEDNGVTLWVIALWFVGSVPIGIAVGKAIKRANQDEED